MTERQIHERDRHDADTVACLLAPQTLAAGTTTTVWVDMQGFDRCLFCVLGGAANDAAATLDIHVHQADTNAGGNAKHLAGLYGSKAITQVTAGTGYAALNQKWLLTVTAEEMDVDASFRYLALVIVVSTADTWLLAAEAVRSVASYEPVGQTMITEIVG